MFYLNELDIYTKDKHEDKFLFKSQKGNHHITTSQVYRMLRNAGNFLERDDIGRHTMRKTFG